MILIFNNVRAVVKVHDRTTFHQAVQRCMSAHREKKLPTKAILSVPTGESKMSRVEPNKTSNTLTKNVQGDSKNKPPS